MTEQEAATYRFIGRQIAAAMLADPNFKIALKEAVLEVWLAVGDLREDYKQFITASCLAQKGKPSEEVNRSVKPPGGEAARNGSSRPGNASPPANRGSPPQPAKQPGPNPSPGVHPPKDARGK